MKVRFIYPSFQRHAQHHPELRECVPCNEYFGPPSLGIAMLAACTPARWELDFRDDRIEDVGLDDPDLDLVAISSFTPSAMRAMQLADALRARGRKVVLGGLFPSAMPQLASAHADAVVIGEGEGVWPRILADAEQGRLAPVYRAAAGTDLRELPLPRTDLYLDKEGPRYCPDDYPVQLSRGCPLACDACALPLSMGRKLRQFPLSHALGQLERLAQHGKLASLTEDTSFFATPRRALEALLDALVDQPASCAISYVGVSMPMILATPDSTLAKLRRAGVRMFYLVGGFDPITQRAFTGQHPEELAKARAAIARAQDSGIEPYTSFLFGNDADDAGCFERVLDFADRAQIRKAEFAIRTPYPGTPSYARLLAADRILHSDFSRYNDANVVFRPARMSAERLQQGYLDVWRQFYASRAGLQHADVRDRTIQF